MNSFIDFIKKEYKILLVGLMWSFILLSLCSKSSYLYSYNDWADLHAFLTVSKGMMNGQVPYKDLFEQKGPLLYLIFGLAYLIDNAGFIGVFILEIIAICASFVCLYKIATLYLDNKIYCVYVAMLMVTLITTSMHFVQGGSAEELCLPIFLSIMYTYLNKDIRFNYKTIFINGILASLLGLIKVNFLAFPFAWMSLLFFEFIFNKEYIKAFKSCLIYLLGMAIPIGLFVIYFVLNDALYDFIDVYILVNFNSYRIDMTFIARFKFIIYYVFMNMLYPVWTLIFNILGGLGLLLGKLEKNKYKIIFILYSCVLLTVSIYNAGLNIKYYYTPLFIYSIFGLILIFKFLSNKNISYKLLSVLIIIFTTISIAFSSNVDELGAPKEAYSQYKFKEIIDECNDKSILNFNTLDLGMYSLLGYQPTVRYFEGQNIDYEKYPYILDGQLSYVKDGLTMWIVTTVDNCEILDKYDNYKLVAKDTHGYEGKEKTIVLYKRVD